MSDAALITSREIKAAFPAPIAPIQTSWLYRTGLIAVVACLILLARAPVHAQESLVDTLSFLLTTQAVRTGDFVRDERSAEVTRDTI